MGTGYAFSGAAGRPTSKMPVELRRRLAGRRKGPGAGNVAARGRTMELDALRDRFFEGVS